jgi:hypothetical protein
MSASRNPQPGQPAGSPPPQTRCLSPEQAAAPTRPHRRHDAAPLLARAIQGAATVAEAADTYLARHPEHTADRRIRTAVILLAEHAMDLHCRIVGDSPAP